jgi:dephospho-CoA kinase
MGKILFYRYLANLPKLIPDFIKLSNAVKKIFYYVKRIVIISEIKFLLTIDIPVNLWNFLRMEVGVMKIIGLTGGIASGKSMVASILEKMGATVIDADQLARRVVEPGTGPYKEIVEVFGKEIVRPDGAIDRKALGVIVFSDPDARKKLERITHPAIKKLALDLMEEERLKGTWIVVYVVPLLLEAGLASTVDEIWVVYADEGTQLERLMKRDLIGREEALRKMSAQMPMDEKIKFADKIIDNTGTPDETRVKVLELWRGLEEAGARG